MTRPTGLPTMSSLLVLIYLRHSRENFFAGFSLTLSSYDFPRLFQPPKKTRLCDLETWFCTRNCDQQIILKQIHMWLCIITCSGQCLLFIEVPLNFSQICLQKKKMCLYFPKTNQTWSNFLCTYSIFPRPPSAVTHLFCEEGPAQLFAATWELPPCAAAPKIHRVPVTPSSTCFLPDWCMYSAASKPFPFPAVPRKLLPPASQRTVTSKSHIQLRDVCPDIHKPSFILLPDLIHVSVWWHTRRL